MIAADGNTERAMGGESLDPKVIRVAGANDATPVARILMQSLLQNHEHAGWGILEMICDDKSVEFTDRVLGNFLQFGRTSNRFKHDLYLPELDVTFPSDVSTMFLPISDSDYQCTALVAAWHPDLGAALAEYVTIDEGEMMEASVRGLYAAGDRSVLLEFALELCKRDVERKHHTALRELAAHRSAVDKVLGRQRNALSPTL